MGTRSYIGKDIGNGKYSVIFCQLESYLETTGRLLTEHYNTPEKVDALLALGDICFLGEKIEPDTSCGKRIVILFRVSIFPPPFSQNKRCRCLSAPASSFFLLTAVACNPARHRKSA